MSIVMQNSLEKTMMFMAIVDPQCTNNRQTKIKITNRKMSKYEGRTEKKEWDYAGAADSPVTKEPFLMPKLTFCVPGAWITAPLLTCTITQGGSESAYSFRLRKQYCASMQEVEDG
jgi:hypothetical protein